MSAPDKSLKLGIIGATGRMGLAVVRAAHEAGLTVTAAISPEKAGRDIGDLAGIGPLGVFVVSDTNGAPFVDAIVDFSSPAGVIQAAAWSKRTGAALVSGTTGLDDAANAALDEAARVAPVLWEPNMSTGVHVLAMLVEEATRRLGADFDVEIVETHHRRKVDAPSGTAQRLAESVRSARNELIQEHGRAGVPGARKKAELGMHAIRGGDVIGDHTVMFLGDGERIELTHRASDRGLFARGAVRAASKLAGRPAARYGMREVI